MYRFNLQALLNYRKLVEERTQVELAQGERALEQNKQILCSYEQEKITCAHELKRKEEKEIDIDTALLYRNYLKGIRKKIREQRDAVAKIKIEVDKKREELLIATKKKKILEKIKEKDQATYVRHQEKKERVVADEIGIRAYQLYR